MDLCLQGSQINLVTRYKPKTPQVKYPSLQRPRSASIFYRKNPSSPFLKRPQSADGKFERNNIDNFGRFFDTNLNDGKLIKNKKYISASSSNLLKFLLDEPIKRPWLLRDTDDNSNRNLSHKKFNQKYSESLDDGSIEEIRIESEQSYCPSDNKKNISFSRPQSAGRLKSHKISNHSLSIPTPITDGKMSQRCSSNHSLSSDLWYNNNKPDLIGRVSFGKCDVYEIDLSDCDNDKQINYTSFPETSKPIKNSIVNNNKKTVSFGNTTEVHSETFEHPKSATDNCSCSTRSSTGSIEETCTSITKCSCNCECQTIEYTKSPKKAVNLNSELHYKSSVTNQTNLNDNFVINEYKNTVEDPNMLQNSSNTDNNSAVQDYKNTLDDEQHKFELEQKLSDKIKNGYFNNSLTNMNAEAPINNPFGKQNQNDFSEIVNNKNAVVEMYQETKRNMVSPVENVKASVSDNSLDSNVVINNYLKVSSNPITTKVTITKSNDSFKQKMSNKVLKTSRTKSGTINGRKKLIAEKTNSSANPSMYTNYRQNSNLNEFQLDKVESWMSMHEDLNNSDLNRSKIIKNHIDENFGECSKINTKMYKQTESIESSQGSRSDDNSQEDTTYDEIVSVIKEIEEDKLKENFAVQQQEIELKLDSSRSDNPNEITADVNEQLKTPDKLESILNYLDDVESSCDKTLLETRRSIPETNRSEIEFVVEPDIAEDVPKLPDLLMLPNHQLARRIIALSLRANELANAVYLSKEHTRKLRLENQKSVRLEKQNAANRLREQKKYFEEIVNRHQGFIEQLLKDKGILCEKVAALTRRLESQSQAWEHKLETELARVKEITLAGEKIRRERWVRENTKKIKELTVKGLESEINQINSTHQKEINDLKKSHQQELLNALDEARQKHEQVEISIRQSCAEDREAVIEKERNTIRERFERQLAEQQVSFDEQKAKLLEQFNEERERLHLEIKQKDREYQIKKQEMTKDKESSLELATAELKENIIRQDEKYQNQINSIKKQFESDLAIWKREFENASKLHEVENENKIRQHYRTERDRQIDVIVTRMDLESQKVQEESEAKLNRLKEKYEVDIREAELTEQKLREKFNAARGKLGLKLAESEAQVQNYQAELKQLQIELDHKKKMCDEFLQEKEQHKENARKDIRFEIAQLKVERDNEIQKIYKRVQQAIEKKDATIEILQKENGSLRERCIKLEAIIRQQRKDYCVK